MYKSLSLCRSSLTFFTSLFLSNLASFFLSISLSLLCFYFCFSLLCSAFTFAFAFAFAFFFCVVFLFFSFPLPPTQVKSLWSIYYYLERWMAEMGDGGEGVLLLGGKSVADAKIH